MKRKIMLSVLALVLLCSAAGCDAGLKIVGMDINTYPDRIVYFAGVDDSLDLTGGTVKYYLKQKTESIYKMENNIYLNITDNINFNEPGVYVVTLTRAEYSCSFPVQVIAADYINMTADDFGNLNMAYVGYCMGLPTEVYQNFDTTDGKDAYWVQRGIDMAKSGR